MERPPAHPTELTDPCCLPALGELGEMSPHGGLPRSLGERVPRPQRLLLTIEMEHDFHAAATEDELSGTIDYFAVSQRLLKFGEGVHWKLIETLAVDIAQMILEEFQPRSVAVEVKKFIIPQARHVSVRVTRIR